MVVCRGELTTYHGPVCNEAHQGIFWQKAETHNKALFQRGKTVFFLAGVHNVEENWRTRGGSGESVFDGGVRKMKLRGNGILSDILIVWWEGVA